MDLKSLKFSSVMGLYASIHRDSFRDFFRYFWSQVCPEPLIDNWHLDFLCDELQKVGRRVLDRQAKAYDLVINVPPNSSKSTLVTQLFPCWLWACDPTLKVISGSYAQDLSLAHAIKSRDVIRSEEYRKLFGVELRQDLDAKGRYANTAGGERLSVSVGSRVTGFHAHVLIVDDPINPAQAYSEAQRTTALEWMRRVLPTRKVDEAVTPTILVMQRVHEHDPTAMMLEQGGVRHICLPPTSDDYPVHPVALADNYVDGLLDPVRKSRAILEERRQQLGSVDFAAQYGQQPSPAQGNIIKKDWFRRYAPGDRRAIAGTVNFVVDPAYTANQANDPTAMLAYRVSGPNLYVLDVEQVWEEFPDLCRTLQSFARRNGYSNASRIYVEPKASGKSIVQSMRAETRLNVMEAPLPQGDKVSRVHGITAALEAGRCLLPESAPWVDGFLDECAVFPRGRDDRVDCLVMAMDACVSGRRVPIYRILGPVAGMR